MSNLWVYLVQSLGAVVLAIILGHFLGGVVRAVRHEERGRR